MEPEPPITILTPVVAKEAAVLDFVSWAIGSQQRLVREGMPNRTCVLAQ